VGNYKTSTVFIMKNIPPKRLYILAAFISIAAGCLAFAVEIMTQVNFFKSYNNHFFFPNFVFASVISVTVFLISSIDIFLIYYNGNKIFKNVRVQLIISIIASFVILLIGFFSIKNISRLIVYNGTDQSITSSTEDPIVSKIILIAVFITVIFFTSFLIFYFVNSWKNILAKREIELEYSKLKIENMEAKYQQLKQQINPHFLFNSLNTLKALVDDNPKAEVFIKRLSDFLRTSISLNNEKTISVEDELIFCTNYLELQKTRFGEALQYSIDIPDEKKVCYIPVFSIQLLVENAIKHNVLTPNHPLYIEITYKRNDYLLISNNMKLKNTSESSSGMGLTNLSERYKLLSGDDIIIETAHNCFSVTIKLLENEYSNH
jgi:two-component system, LytTR family, sensor kinase